MIEYKGRFAPIAAFILTVPYTINALTFPPVHEMTGTYWQQMSEDQQWGYTLGLVAASYLWAEGIRVGDHYQPVSPYTEEIYNLLMPLSEQQAIILSDEITNYYQSGDLSKTILNLVKELLLTIQSLSPNQRSYL